MKFNLNLEESPSDSKRDLILFQNHILAIGGENGNITAAPLDNLSFPPEFKVVHQIDDPIQCMTINSDGSLMALGMEDGSVDIYAFDKEKVHPLLKPLVKSEDDFFTQEEDTFETCLIPAFKLEQRFDASIRALQFCPQKNLLAVATESFPGIAIFEINEGGSKLMYQDEELNGGRTVLYSPDGTRCVSLGLDGKFYFYTVDPAKDHELDWDQVYATQTLVEKDMGQFGTVLQKSRNVAYSSKGNIVAFSGSRDLHLRLAIDLKKERMVLKTLEDVQGQKDDIVTVVFDPSDDHFVVTVAQNGEVGLWKLNLSDDENMPEGSFLGVIATFDDSLCTDMHWYKADGQEEQLLLAFENGSMEILSVKDAVEPVKAKEISVVSSNVTEEEEQQEEVEKEQEISETQEAEFETQPLDESKSDDATNDFFDSDDDVEFSQEDKEKTAKKNQFVADEAEDENDDENQANVDKEKEQTENDEFDDVLDSNVDKDEDIADVDDLEDMQLAQQDEEEDDYDELPSSGTNVVSALPEPQAPFAPSSTPLGQRRILCWNQHGIISSRERVDLDGSHRTIDFSFTDSASNRPISFRDPYNFIIGTFGEEGGLFASDLMEDVDEDDVGDDDLLQGMSDATRAIVKKSRRRKNGLKSDKATGSTIYFHRFATVGAVADKDWTLALPEGERVNGCASGAGWNAVTTSRRFLRLFSTSGVQGPMIWLKGEAVTVVGRDRLCAVIYHDGNPLVDGTQKLGYSLYDGVTGRLIVEGSVSAMSPGSSLSWAGFNTDMSLCVMDEDGMLSMLVASKIDRSVGMTYRWSPILDTLGLKKSREDEFWPVHVQEGRFICVPLKGVKHPDPARRPLPTSYPLRMPLARGNGGRSIGMDEVSVRSNLALENKKFMHELELLDNPAAEEELEDEYTQACANVDKVILKLLFDMLKNNNIENAFDLSQRLHLEKSFEIAMEAADRFGQTKLSDRIYDVREQRFPAVQEDEVEEQHEDEQSYEAMEERNTRPLMQRAPITPAEALPNGKRRLQQDEESFASDDESIEEPLAKRLKAKTRNPFSKKLKEAAEEKDLDRTPAVVNKSRSRNPFAKKMKESPPKEVMDSPPPKKATLSRSSTFSHVAREQSKLSKHLL